LNDLVSFAQTVTSHSVLAKSFKAQSDLLLQLAQPAAKLIPFFLAFTRPKWCRECRAFAKHLNFRGNKTRVLENLERHSQGLRCCIPPCVFRQWLAKALSSRKFPRLQCLPQVPSDFFVLRWHWLTSVR